MKDEEITMKQYKEKCEICGGFAAPGDTPLKARINLGHHRRSKHNIKGGYSTRYKKKLKGKAKRGRPKTVKVQAPAAEQCKLDHCPNCGSRFYIVAG